MDAAMAAQEIIPIPYPGTLLRCLACHQNDNVTVPITLLEKTTPGEVSADPENPKEQIRPFPTYYISENVIYDEKEGHARGPKKFLGVLCIRCNTKLGMVQTDTKADDGDIGEFHRRYILNGYKLI